MCVCPPTGLRARSPGGCAGAVSLALFVLREGGGSAEEGGSAVRSGRRALAAPPRGSLAAGVTQPRPVAPAAPRGREGEKGGWWRWRLALRGHLHRAALPPPPAPPRDLPPPKVSCPRRRWASAVRPRGPGPAAAAAAAAAVMGCAAARPLHNGGGRGGQRSSLVAGVGFRWRNAARPTARSGSVRPGPVRSARWKRRARSGHGEASACGG